MEVTGSKLVVSKSLISGILTLRLSGINRLIVDITDISDSQLPHIHCLDDERIIIVDRTGEHGELFVFSGKKVRSSWFPFMHYCEKPVG